MEQCTHVHLLEQKLGGGIGVALCGWLLDISGFVINISSTANIMYQYASRYVLMDSNVIIIMYYIYYVKNECGRSKQETESTNGVC